MLEMALIVWKLRWDLKFKPGKSFWLEKMQSRWICIVALWCIVSANDFENLQEQLKKAYQDLNFEESLKNIADSILPEDTVSFQDVRGNLADISMEELKEKMKGAGSVPPMSKEGTESLHQMPLAEVHQKDAGLAFYIGLARFGLQTLQSQGYAKDEQLAGFSDAMEKKPVVAAKHEVELILKTSSGSKYQLLFHGSTALYRGGVGITNAWELNEKDEKKKEIKLPLPPPPQWRDPRFLIVVAGAILIAFGTILVLCSMCCGPEKKKKD